MARFLGLLLCAAVVWAGPPVRAQNAVERGGVPAWVEITSDAPATPANSDEGLRLLLFDTQFRAEADRQSYYVRTRSQALSPQGVAALGNVAVTWSPSSQTVTVHHVNIVREGQTIDLLATQSFETLRREENLELAMLDGVLTASLQPSGLRTGDILDVAYTLVSRDPVTTGHAEQSISLNFPVLVDQVRYRASWPTALPVRLRASDDWTPLRPRRDGDYSFVEVQRDALLPVVVPSNVPGRLGVVNRVELSDYRAWSDISVTLKPLYDRARRIEANSPLPAEVERIRALSSDPAVQAAAALRLVQEDVRYVALLMGEGALTPATADETWTRRFGDCKGKTALLLALLDGLGIEAEPALVSLTAGDGLDQRLPMISAFNHVVVRARVAGETYWLDGTRTGDRRLADIGVPPFFWALPLTDVDADLVPLVVAPRTSPSEESRVVLDATAGLYAPATATVTQILRDEEAAVLGGQLGLLSRTQRDELLRAWWTTRFADVTITDVGSIHDTEAGLLTFTMTGTTILDWEEGLVPPGSTYPRLRADERADGPYRSAPYIINHPYFSRQIVSLRLPDGGTGFRVSGGEVARTELGFHQRRSVRLEGDLVTIDVAIRSLTNEISAAEVERVVAAAGEDRYDPPRVFAPTDYAMTQADLRAFEDDVPTTAAEWLDRALALSGAGDFQGAFEAADRAVELAPEESSTWANRGVYRFSTGDLDGARADIAKAVDLDPSERIAMNGNAMIAMAEGRHQDAVVELSMALRQKPDDQFALERRAQAYVRLEDFDRAVRDADALIAARPDDLAFKIFRVLILERAGRTDDVDRDIASLMDQHPDDRLVPINHAAILLERGQAEAASDVMDGLSIDPSPNEVSTLILRAEISIAMGRLDLATRDFDTIREMEPANAGWLNNLCWTAAEAGVLLEQALRDCDAALAISPRAASYIDSRARVLLQTGDHARALAAYEEALEIAPQQAASLYGRGLARIALGQVEAGEADKAAAIQISPAVVSSFKSYATGPSDGVP